MISRAMSAVDEKWAQHSSRTIKEVDGLSTRLAAAEVAVGIGDEQIAEAKERATAFHQSLQDAKVLEKTYMHLHDKETLSLERGTYVGVFHIYKCFPFPFVIVF